MPKKALLYKKMKIEELVILAQNDDIKAIEELIKNIQTDIYATLSYMLKSNDNISALTQDILIKVVKNINTLQSPKCFKGWLNHIITNSYYDYLRKKMRKPDEISIENECNCNQNQIKFEIPDNSSKPIEKCITSECEQQIKQAIRGLPEVFRLAIILREFQGLSYEQIANTTNSSIGTVKSRISRARIKLQEVLKNYA